jgi:hypothetical protein
MMVEVIGTLGGAQPGFGYLHDRHLADAHRAHVVAIVEFEIACLPSGTRLHTEAVIAGDQLLRAGRIRRIGSARYSENSAFAFSSVNISRKLRSQIAKPGVS